MRQHKGMGWTGFLLMVAAWAIVLPLPGLAVEVRGEAIKSAIVAHVEKNMPWTPGSVRVGFISPIADAIFPHEAIALEVQSKPEEGFIGETDFTVKYISRGALVKTDRVRARLEVLMDVVVSSRSLTRNQQLGADDIWVQKKWQRRITEHTVTDPEAIIGKALTVSIRQNTEITRNIVKAPLLIKKGAVVRILLDNGMMNITTLGISEEDGAAESLIKVKNLSSNRTVYARVASDSLVKVEF